MLPESASPPGVRTTKPPLRLLHLTDTHILGDPRDRLRAVDTAANLQAVVAHWRHQPLTAVLVTGDLVQEPSPAAYQRCRDLLQGFRVPVHSLPGNHDDPELLHTWCQSLSDPAQATPPPGAAEPAGPRQRTGCKLTTLGDWRLISLDSSQPGRIAGRLSSRCLASLEQTLAKAPATPSLIALHHPPLPIEVCPAAMRLENAAELLEVLARHPQVRAVLCGHLHQHLDQRAGPVPILVGPAVAMQFTADGDSIRVRSPRPGYRLLTCYASGEVVSEVGELPTTAVAGPTHLHPF